MLRSAVLTDSLAATRSGHSWFTTRRFLSVTENDPLLCVPGKMTSPRQRVRSCVSRQRIQSALLTWVSDIF